MYYGIFNYPDVKRYQPLRYSRIAISVAITAALTLVWTEYGDSAAGVLGWAEKTQIVVAGTVTVALLQLLFWLIVGFVFGRVYCSGFCPLGTWFDLVSRIGRAIRRHTGRPDRYSYTLPANRTRITAMIVAIVCMAVGISFIPMLIEPDSIWHNMCRSALHPLWGHINNFMAASGIPEDPLKRVAFVAITGVSMTSIAIALLVLIAVSIPALFSGRSYCNTVCPIGTALSMTSRYAMWHIDIDTDTCIDCGRCVDNCKSGCIDLKNHVVDMSRCVNCYNCLPDCPNDAIFYRPTRKQLSWPLMQSVKPSINSQPQAQTSQTQNIKPLK